VTYVRWGRTECDGDATVLYQGYAAGSDSLTVLGGGTELLCLPNTPQWGTIIPGYQDMSLLVGVEYELLDSNPFSTANNNDQSLNNHNMPCAVCHVQKRSVQLMIPARTSCPSGWTLEYWGYIVSTHQANYKGSFNCIDEAPESVAGGGANENPHRVFVVETICHALPCPPYTSGNEVTCAVCSK